ncbi:MAG: hypothetical protein HKN05_01860 [Rhizobiales bacterium]|nr:hypothetical protein [Hyphomicrobiales bacterium]
MNENIKNTTSSTSETLRLGGRFHYWSGQSGSRYIFSIYKPGSCPPLPGAVYVIANKRPDGSRDALAIGRFPSLWECAGREAAKLIRASGGDEVHVHLLAENDREAEDIVCDLKPALGGVVRLRPSVPVRRPQVTGPEDGFSDEHIDLFGLNEIAAPQATAA